MNSKGFTLIELLIILAMIGIVVAIAIPQFKAYKERVDQKNAPIGVVPYKQEF